MLRDVPIIGKDCAMYLVFSRHSSGAECGQFNKYRCSSRTSLRIAILTTAARQSLPRLMENPDAGRQRSASLQQWALQYSVQRHTSDKGIDRCGDSSSRQYWLCCFSFKVAQRRWKRSSQGRWRVLRSALALSPARSRVIIESRTRLRPSATERLVKRHEVRQLRQRIGRQLLLRRVQRALGIQ